MISLFDSNIRKNVFFALGFVKEFDFVQIKNVSFNGIPILQIKIWDCMHDLYLFIYSFCGYPLEQTMPKRIMDALRGCNNRANSNIDSNRIFYFPTISLDVFKSV